MARSGSLREMQKQQLKQKQEALFIFIFRWREKRRTVKLALGVNIMRSWLIKLHNSLDMSAEKSQNVKPKRTVNRPGQQQQQQQQKQQQQQQQVELGLGLGHGGDNSCKMLLSLLLLA